MKNKLTLIAFCIFFLQTVHLPAQNYWVPDFNFRNYLIGNYPSCFTAQDSLITNCADIQNETTLAVYFQGISNLEGVEYFISLNYLDCGGNFLTALPSLPPNLTHLSCIGNLLSSLPTLPDSLIVLDCVDNLLNVLPNLPSTLYVVYCNDNALTTLPQLPASMHLLLCENNQLTSLPFLPLALDCMVCNNNPLSCLPVLPNTLSYLEFSNTFITCMPNIPPALVGFGPLCSPSVKKCNYAYAEGYVFKDDNGNGIMDSTDQGLSLQINYTGGFSVQSDTNGFFTAITDTGNITYQISIPDYYTTSTPASQTVPITMNTVQQIHFGLIPTPNIYDLRIKLDAINPLRPGFKVNYKIQYRNAGTEPQPNCVIKFLKPNQLSNFTSNPPPALFSGDTLVWLTGNLNPNASGYITVLDSVSASTALGQIAMASAWIAPVAFDVTPQNNYDFSNETIRGSFDPNDKSVSPEFVSPNQSDYLEYIIRFQNTGTDTAFSVLITDTLSADLDVASIVMVSASHTVAFWVEQGIVKWYFTNILLPDSNVNEANSHGYVKFRIRQKANLTVGTQIENTANIYFDYNAAVLTNTIVVNVTPLSVPALSKDKMQLFPNPVHRSVYLKNNDNQSLGKVELINAEGRVIEIRKIETSSFDWQVEQLPVGVYFFKGENWKQKVVKK